jgi:hypothetical protein
MKQKRTACQVQLTGCSFSKERPNIWSTKIETICPLSKTLIFLAEEINA